jgi:hypothetical protein
MWLVDQRMVPLSLLERNGRMILGKRIHEFSFENIEFEVPLTQVNKDAN